MALRKNRLAGVVLAVALTISCAMVPTFAEELPIDKATPDKATVSEKVDQATNTDPEIGTQFFMYIPPDIVEQDIPKMGDEGVPTSTLVLAALATGAGFLTVSKYAFADRRGHAKAVS